MARVDGIISLVLMEYQPILLNDNIHWLSYRRNGEKVGIYEILCELCVKQKER